ncbi:S1-C subfamily serine protease [Alkalibacillus almallahensis]|nr:S1-C subfamily serine protease [Alkalibacillus almallahensis]
MLKVNTLSNRGIFMQDDDKRLETEDESDLYEDLNEDEIKELLNERRYTEKEHEPKTKRKRRIPKWFFWLIALFMVINIFATLPVMVSIPAIDFLKTSAQLLADDEVQSYRKAIATIDAGDSRGTGFAFADGQKVLTNDHVIEGQQRLQIYFKEDGPYGASVQARYPELDLAILDLHEETRSATLPLAGETNYTQGEPFYFIGSPLGFSGIANEGEIIGETSSEDIESPVLMLDAPIYSGNSGSPVINQSGEVVAVIFATRKDDERGRIGLAIPIEAFHDLNQ